WRLLCGNIRLDFSRIPPVHRMEKVNGFLPFIENDVFDWTMPLKSKGRHRRGTLWGTRRWHYLCFKPHSDTGSQPLSLASSTANREAFFLSPNHPKPCLRKNEESTSMYQVIRWSSETIIKPVLWVMLCLVLHGCAAQIFHPTLTNGDFA